MGAALALSVAAAAGCGKVVIVNEPPPKKKPVEKPPPPPEPKAVVGQTVPSFSLPRLRSEEFVDLHRFRGRTLVLFFFASYSKASERWLPAYRDLAKQLEGRNVEIIGVAEDADESMDRVQTFIDRTAPDVPVALDLNHELGEAFAIEELPAVAIIDAESTVRLIQPTIHGEADLRATESKLHEIIQAGPKTSR